MFGRFILISVLVCASGEKLVRLEGRILGGEVTTIRKFPYQVSLLYKGKHLCGGTIISETVIITAAHCMFFRFSGGYQVKAGSTHISDHGVRIAPRDIIVHEDFGQHHLQNDIALMLLAKPLQFSNSIQAIPLAESGEEINPGAIAYVSGWGLLTEHGITPDALSYVAIKLIDAQTCNKMYKDTKLRITESMVCAGTPEGGKDACHKDSGGPLMSDGKLVGIVSWGLGCGHKEHPGVYTKVSYYRDWIDKNRPDK